MKFRKPQIESIELNLTPMIDCLLFLVVFLLLSTTFNKYSRLNLVLPQANGVPEKQLPTKIEVAVEQDGSYTVNGVKLAASTENELTTAMKQVAGSDRQRPIVIAADSKATHQSVVQVMDVAGKLGFVNLNISTRIPPSEH